MYQCRTCQTAASGIPRRDESYQEQQKNQQQPCTKGRRQETAAVEQRPTEKKKARASASPGGMVDELGMLAEKHKPGGLEAVGCLGLPYITSTACCMPLTGRVAATEKSLGATRKPSSSLSTPDSVDVSNTVHLKLAILTRPWLGSRDPSPQKRACDNVQEKYRPSAPISDARSLPS